MKNIDYLNNIVADKNELPLDVVKKINKEYWAQVKKELNEFKHTNLNIPRLGTFGISRFLLNKKIKFIIRQIRRYRKPTYETNRRIFIKESYYKTLKKLLYQRNEIAKVYYERFNRLYKINS